MIEDSGTPLRVGIRELRGNLARYLRRAKEGCPVLVTSRNLVIAEIRPPPADQHQPRRPGALRGKIAMADDFDHLPAEILDAIER